MRKLMICLAVIALLSLPVSALDITAPPVPPAGADYMPDQTENFSDAVLQILGDAVSSFWPDLSEALRACFSAGAAALALSLINLFPGHQKGVADLAGTLAVGTLLLRATNSLIALGVDTVAQLSDYGKLLLPVMAAALAAQGGITSAAGLYAATAVFDAALSGFAAKLLVPLLYLFLALAVGCAASEEPLLKKIRDGLKSTAVWCLKTALYVYTGYISITGVVSGTADASVLKAAKLTISGVVPVVGSILSDASEAVLIGAGTVKNTAGIYGLLAVLAVWIGPFVRIGAHYLILKALAAFCGVLGIKSVSDLVADFSTAMGLLLAMTGAVCMMLIISTICFMKGVGI